MLGGPPPLGGPRQYFGGRSFPHDGGHVLGSGEDASVGRGGGRGRGEEEKGVRGGGVRGDGGRGEGGTGEGGRGQEGRGEGGRGEGGRGEGGRGEDMEVDRHHDGVDVEMEDRSPAHSDMELDSDYDNVQPIPLPPGSFHMPPQPNFGPPLPHQRGLRRPRMQFSGMPPLGGGEVFGGEGHKLGSKDMPVMLGDAQLIREEAGECVCVCSSD